jgi:hypothetical protein
MLFLFNSEIDHPKFTDVLVDVTKITTIRLIKKDSDTFILAVEDVNDNGFCAAFKTEESLRAKAKELIASMKGNPSYADTMKLKDLTSKSKDEVTEKLFELLKSLKS